MKKTTFLVFLIFASISCKNASFYKNRYTRADRGSRLFHEQYSTENDYCLGEIRNCHFIKTPGFLSSSGKIFFTLDSIENTLRMSYSRQLSVISVEPTERVFFDRNCAVPPGVINSESDILSRESEKRCPFLIYPQFEVMSNSIKNMDGGGGMEAAMDMDDDKHLLEYKLTTAIYQNDTLIYMDNRTHWTEVFSERGEQVIYQVPQVIIDSLVTLTLQEYFKRME